MAGVGVSDLEGRVLAKLRCGARLVVNPNEYLGRSVYYTGDWDRKITWVISKLLRPGDVFIDIGAHCGVAAIAAAKLMGPSGVVHAFEPQPDLAVMLAESAKSNGYNGVYVHNIALSDKAAELDLFIVEGKQIYATLEPSDARHKRIQVRVENASDFLMGLNLEKVRLIKIDVEGHEETILSAARRFLDATPVDAILFESVATEGSFWRRHTILLLASMGYRFISIPKRMLTMKTFVVADQIDPDPACHDFVAVSSGKFDEIANALKMS
jgi:FkbM family methyltransferase